MEPIRLKLQRAIERSKAAYGLYIRDKKYYQALRIKQANNEVYGLLQSFLYECKDSEIGVVHVYLFHLEDWFHQFEYLERNEPALESEFVFERFVDTPPFPKNILTILKITK